MTLPSSRPAWVDDLVGRYQAGIAHAFILHFGVRDYVTPGIMLHAYLDQLLASTEVIVHYDRAGGMRFPAPAMRNNFMALVGLQGGNQAMAALRATQGQGREDDLPTAPTAVLPLLDRLLRQSSPVEGVRRAAVIIDYAETIAPAADKAAMSPGDRDALVTLLHWGTDVGVAASGNMVIMIANSLTEIHPDLRAASAGYEAIQVPLPSYDARLDYINTLGSGVGGDGVAVELAAPAEAVAALTAGLSKRNIEDIWLRAATSSTREVTVALVKTRKGEIMASEYRDVLAPIDARFGWEAIGGLEHVKRFFERSVIVPMRTGQTSRVPMGVLLTGPAGTGKSAIAEAVIKESGVNGVALRADKIKSKYLGETEQKLERALQAITEMAPVIVFIDEVDQRLRRGEGGGGSADAAENAVFSRILEYMADTSHRGRVVFIAATNRPDLLDAAIKRPGRFDKKVPMLMPDDSGRIAIINAMLRRYQIPHEAQSPPAGDEQLGQLALETEGWSGAELEGLVIKANEDRLDLGREYMTIGDLLGARTRLSPSTSDVEFMTAVALRECNDLDLLPEGYRDMLTDRRQLEQRIQELTPAAPKGRGRRQL